MKIAFKEFIPYLMGFILVSALVFYPELQGKKLTSHDTISNVAAAKEFNDYKDKGEIIQWTNRIFSGMPLYTLAGGFNGNYIGYIFGSFVDFFPTFFGHLLALLLCTFISLILLNVNKKIAFFLSIANGLNVFVLGSLWAGHGTKIMSMGYMLPAIAGYIAFIQNKNYKGLIAVGIGSCLSILYGHYQMVYYGIIVLFILTIYFIYEAFHNKLMGEYLKRIGLAAAIGIIGVCTYIPTLIAVQNYSKETMRGGKTELTKKSATSTGKSGGLDFNYAMSWSYSIEELVSFIAPDALGGSSNYKLKNSKSKLAEAYGNSEGEQVLPMYWGLQPFSGAPNYYGATMFALFIFSIVFLRHKLKIVLLVICLISTFLGLGRHFELVNRFLFDYLPMYNKFRTPAMAFSIFNCLSIFIIGLAFNQLIKEELDSKELIKKLKKSGYFTLGILIIGYVLVNNLGYTSDKDAEQFQNNKQALDLLIEDRISLFKSDIIRAFIFAGIIFSILFLYSKNKLSLKILYITLSILIFIDLFTIYKRYLYYDDFQKIESYESLIPNEPWNTFLEQDKSHFRVFNTTNQSIFNDNTEGYRYSNIGGYSPAKLFRYQDLIDMHISKGNMPVLNMLNTKYFIIENNGQKSPQQNPDACGNAWFINEVKFAKNADEEMDSIGTFNPKKTVWIDQRYKNETELKTNSDLNATINLTKYHPDRMEYSSNSLSGGFALFSEIWYKGNEDWNLYIDGKKSKMIRSNYILRGAFIPSGNHKIEMKFETKDDKLYKYISIFFCTLLLVSILFIYYKKINIKVI